MYSFGAPSYVYSGINKLAHSQNNHVVCVNYAGTTTINGKTYSTLKIPTYRKGPDNQYHNYRQEWLTEELDVSLEALGIGSLIDLDWDTGKYEGTSVSFDKNGRYYWSSWSYSGGVYDATLGISPFAWSNKIDSVYGDQQPVSIIYEGKRYYNPWALVRLDEKLKDSGWRVPNATDFLSMSRFFYYNDITNGHLPSTMFNYVPEFNSSTWGKTLVTNKVVSTSYGAQITGPRYYKPWDGGGRITITDHDSSASYIRADVTGMTNPNSFDVLPKYNGLDRTKRNSELVKTIQYANSSGEVRFWPSRLFFNEIDRESHDFWTIVGVSESTGEIDSEGALRFASRLASGYNAVFMSVRLCRSTIIS